ncbi:MAG: hypothetical protein ACTHMT_00875 [Verrucomicrobiota bacterium]
MKTIAFLCLSVLLGYSAVADMVECDNGDRYTGKVLSLNEKELKLKNDIQGTITIPREKITVIALKPAVAATLKNRPAPRLNSSLVVTNGNPQIDPNAVAQVQQQFLGEANPEANRLFQEMVAGLMSGKLDVNDIRSKAQSTLGDLKSFEKEIGDGEDADMLRTYMGLLQNFLSASAGQTNITSKPLTPTRPVAPVTPGTPAKQDE